MAYPIDSYTKLLIQFEGADGATSYTAETGQTVSFTQAELDTDIAPPFGTSSLKVNGAGNGGLVTVPASVDFNFDGDFTVDFWTRFESFFTSYGALIGNNDTYNGSSGWSLISKNNHSLLFLGNYTSSWKIYLQVETSLTLNEWYHLAIVRHGTSVKIYKDGVEIGSATDNPVTSLTDNKVLWVGRNASPYAYAHDARYREVRVSKGIARWTSNFNPPARPYGYKSNQQIIIV